MKTHGHVSSVALFLPGTRRSRRRSKPKAQIPRSGESGRVGLAQAQAEVEAEAPGDAEKADEDKKASESPG